MIDYSTHHVHSYSVWNCLTVVDSILAKQVLELMVVYYVLERKVRVLI